MSPSSTMAENGDSPKRRPEVIDLATESSDRPRKKMMLDFRQQIKIMVKGRSGHYEHYQVPANIAKARSAFIREHCGTNSTMVIEEERPWLVRPYLHLICTDQIVLSSDEEALNARSKCELTIALYMLAQKLGDAVSANLIIDHLSTLLDSGLPVELIPLVYDRQEAGSPLRRLFVNYVAETMSAGRFTSKPANRWHQEFLYDVVGEMAKRRDAQGLRLEKLSSDDTRQYHLQS
ncbi:hypothetical protein PRZ48_015136 [Zasmidium cellare]|uniref:Uncharacterized protein n=1 Tax=Zasmidium cellare TaxID=395010 RepID=A0ABR0DXQ5_ZASCE|nr:hypothetical protein PRZ48_015136 [Zasmidium cellare]